MARKNMPPLPRRRGYGDCWYCSEVVVDPIIVSIPDPDCKPRLMRVLCCDRCYNGGKP